MFVRSYLELPLAAAQVEQTLVDAPPGWLATLSTTAQEHSEGLAARVGVGVAGPSDHQVVLELGRPVHLPTVTWLPLRWDPAGADGLLPRLEATIELGALGQDRTQLAISARYRPPAAAAGHGLDLGLAQRLAEATVKDFLDQLGHAIVLSHLGPAANMPP